MMAIKTTFNVFEICSHGNETWVQSLGDAYDTLRDAVEAWRNESQCFPDSPYWWNDDQYRIAEIGDESMRWVSEAKIDAVIEAMNQDWADDGVAMRERQADWQASVM